MSARRGRTPAKPYYERISEQLIARLEAGVAPLQRPWKAGEWQAPYNPTTDAPYQGANALWLAMQGRADPRWMTYKQAQGIQAQVLKGESGTPIQYWKFHDEVIERDSSGQPRIDSSGNTIRSRIALARDADKITTHVMGYDKGLVTEISSEKRAQIRIQTELFVEQFEHPLDRARIRAGIEARLDKGRRQPAVDEPVVEREAEPDKGPEL